MLYYWELRTPTKRAPSKKTPSRKAAAGLVLRSRPGTLAALEAVGEGVLPEFIDGMLYEPPATPFIHRHIIDQIVRSLRQAYLGKGESCRWWIEPEVDFRTRSGNVLRPDVVGWRGGRLDSAPVLRRARKVPDWVCEIVSPGTRAHDLGLKRHEYARAGVRYRWYVDPDVRVLQAFELKRTKWIESIRSTNCVVTGPFSACISELHGTREPRDMGEARGAVARQRVERPRVRGRVGHQGRDAGVVGVATAAR